MNKGQENSFAFIINSMIRIELLQGDEQPQIFEEALKIIYATQGLRSVADHHVFNYARGNKSSAFGALYQQRLIGVATAVIRTQENFPIYKKNIISEKVLPDSALIGFMRCMSILPEFQGQGVGKALVAARINWMINQGVERAWVMSWINGQKFNSQNVYRALKFKHMVTLSNFFESSSCIICGEKCQCSVGLYIKDL